MSSYQESITKRRERPRAKGFFHPTSICVVEATKITGKLGKIVLENLGSQGFHGSIYPVNRSLDEIDGMICYHSIEDIPITPDSSMVVIPALKVLDPLNGALSKRYQSCHRV